MENLIIYLFTMLADHRAILYPVGMAAIAWFTIHYGRRIKALAKDHDVICQFITDIRKSIDDPDKSHGEDRYLTRAEMISILNKILGIAKTKGCVDTCPALPHIMEILERHLDQNQEEMRTFIKQSLQYRQDLKDANSEQSARLNSFLDRQLRITEILAANRKK